MVRLGPVFLKKPGDPRVRGCCSNPKLTGRAYGREHSSFEPLPSLPMETSSAQSVLLKVHALHGPYVSCLSFPEDPSSQIITIPNAETSHALDLGTFYR